MGGSGNKDVEGDYTFFSLFAQVRNSSLTHLTRDTFDTIMEMDELKDGRE